MPTRRFALPSGYRLIRPMPEDGVPYDVLLILRGCTGCPYLYEEIEAAHRVVVAAADEIPQAIDRIRSFTSQA